MSLTLQQLETGKSYVFHRIGFAFGEFAATFVALETEPEMGRSALIHVREIETGFELEYNVAAVAAIVPLTREWLEARMAGHAATVIDLHARCSNLLNARKVL
jgi:hypothetical protein